MESRVGILNRSHEALQILRALIKPTFVILLWMSALRALIFVGVYSNQIGWHSDLPAAFFAGFRFDLLIMGFFWIPIVLITWAIAMFASPRKLFSWWRVYLAISVLFIFDLYWMDLLWTAGKNFRLNHEFMDASRQVAMDTGWTALGRSRAMVFTASMAVSSLGLLFLIYWTPLKEFKKKLSSQALIVWAIFSVFAVAFAARGTFTPHHLNIEHAQVSQDPEKGPLINQLPLNPVWNMDK